MIKYQTSVDRHNYEIYKNKISWENKLALRKVYEQFYTEINKQIDRSLNGDIIEIGSGMGNIKSIIPDCITTDLFKNDWLDRQENLYDLNINSNSVSHLILFDVWHHIEYPIDALIEFNRVLCHGGKIIMLEPDMSIIGKLIYGLFHPEPLGFHHKFPDQPSLNNIKNKTNYFAAQSSCYRLFLKNENPLFLTPWNKTCVKRIVSFSYLGSGGFQGPQLYPNCAIKFMRFLDIALSPFTRLFSARLLVVIEKKYE